MTGCITYIIYEMDALPSPPLPSINWELGIGNWELGADPTGAFMLP